MPQPIESPTIRVRLTLNGQGRDIDVEPRERLLDTLRYRLGLTGTKEGCGEGECGACCVLLDGLPANSCLIPTIQARGRSVETIEHVDRASLTPLLESGATQCGACTPGVVVTAAWIRAHPELLHGVGSRGGEGGAGATLRELMAGNLCRCTGYDGIINGLNDWIRQTPASTPADPAKPRAGHTA